MQGTVSPELTSLLPPPKPSLHTAGVFYAKWAPLSCSSLSLGWGLRLTADLFTGVNRFPTWSTQWRRLPPGEVPMTATWGRAEQGRA